LKHLKDLNGGLLITDNDLLTSLSELQNLTSIYGPIGITGNRSLATLVGLENIDPNGIFELTFQNNDSLTECSILSVCRYLNQQPAFTMISNNFSGCMTREEVEDKCTTSAGNNWTRSPVQVYPNPTTGQIEITGASHSTMITVFDILGQIVMQHSSPTQISLEQLPANTYYLYVKSGDEIQVIRLVKI
jgi:hypothetical protein